MLKLSRPKTILRSAIFAKIPGKKAKIVTLDLKKITEIVVKVVSEPVDSLIRNRNIDEGLAIKLAGASAELIAELIPPGPAKAAGKTLAILLDSYDNGIEFGKQANKLYDNLAAPINELYNLKRQALFKEYAIKDILLLQKKNPSQFASSNTH